jgi:hypothetical protein
MKHFPRWPLSGLALCVAIATAFAAIDLDTSIPTEHPAIQYLQTAPDDPVTRLAKRIDKGEVKLDYIPGRLGYLPSLLKNLNINADSQMLVFTKTSFQAPLISPRSPRALFFNDNVSVGSVKGGDVLELAALDRRQGIVFYTLGVDKTAHPIFARRNVCLQCHQVRATLGVPGLEVGSSFPKPDGTPNFSAGYIAVDQRIPLEQRWGGWFVTGSTGSVVTRANSIAPDPEKPGELDTSESHNLTSLASKVDLDGYLAQTSDIVALMVLEHQTRMTNLIIRIGWETRIAGHDGKLAEAGPGTESEKIESEIDDMIEYMLFANEAPLKEPVTGVSTFTKTFPQRGPRDKQGRSLRDFDLKTRMFKYPLSYMIYTEAFDAMPDWARQRIYQKLYDVLTNKNTSAKFARISAADRQNVLQIVRETNTGLPDYWKN